jgi:hypothetical protein
VRERRTYGSAASQSLLPVQPRRPLRLSVLEAMGLGRTIVPFDVRGAPKGLGNHAVRERYLAGYRPERLATRLNRCPGED